MAVVPVASGRPSQDIQAAAIIQLSTEELTCISAELQRKVEAVTLELLFSVDQSTGRAAADSHYLSGGVMDGDMVVERYLQIGLPKTGHSR